MNEFYVYQLEDPRYDFRPFYIGKGKGNRASHHLRRLEGSNKFKQHVIDKIRAEGLEPSITIIVDHLTEHEAFEFERTLIAKYGRRCDSEDGILTNLTIGGEGVSGFRRSPELQAAINEQRRLSGVYDRIAEANKGRIPSEESRRKMQQSALTRPPMSEETKQAKRLAMLGRTLSANHRAKLSEAKTGSSNPMFGRISPNKGKAMSDEQRELIRQSRLGSKATGETKDKMREARKGKSHSQETKQKMAESRRLWHAKRKEFLK